MDMHYYIAPGGLRVCVMVDGDRDDDGNITTVHTMYVIFRRRYTRERRYWIPPERWAAVNRKYCLGTLNV